MPGWIVFHKRDALALDRMHQDRSRNSGLRRHVQELMQCGNVVAIHPNSIPSRGFHASFKISHRKNIVDRIIAHQTVAVYDCGQIIQLVCAGI